MYLVYDRNKYLFESLKKSENWRRFKAMEFREKKLADEITIEVLGPKSGTIEETNIDNDNKVTPVSLFWSLSVPTNIFAG